MTFDFPPGGAANIPADVEIPPGWARVTSRTSRTSRTKPAGSWAAPIIAETEGRSAVLLGTPGGNQWFADRYYAIEFGRTR